MLGRFADPAGKDSADALGRAHQEKAAGVEAFGSAGESVAFVDADALATNPGGASFETVADALCGGLEVSGCGEGGEFAFEGLQEGEEDFLARPVVTGLEKERGGKGSEVLRKLWLVDIDADADDRMADAGDFRVELGEDAAKFTRAEEQVIGPAKIGLERGDGADRIVHGESSGEREPEDVGGRDKGTKEDADVEPGAGRRGPRVGAATAALEVCSSAK
jgi:hypothetical protein